MQPATPGNSSKDPFVLSSARHDEATADTLKLATNIAALVVVERGGFDPESLQQIYQNYAFLNEIALSGILPITFTLFNLYLISMISWYLIFLSSLSIVLSIATLGVVGHFSPSESDLKALAAVASKGGPSECGNMQPHGMLPLSMIFFLSQSLQN